MQRETGEATFLENESKSAERDLLVEERSRFEKRSLG
jgi:hypothetical protein